MAKMLTEHEFEKLKENTFKVIGRRLRAIRKSFVVTEEVLAEWRAMGWLDVGRLDALAKKRGLSQEDAAQVLSSIAPDVFSTGCRITVSNHELGRNLSVRGLNAYAILYHCPVQKFFFDSWTDEEVTQIDENHVRDFIFRHRHVLISECSKWIDYFNYSYSAIFRWGPREGDGHVSRLKHISLTFYMKIAFVLDLDLLQLLFCEK